MATFSSRSSDPPVPDPTSATGPGQGSAPADAGAELARSERDLEDIRYALDQSAIVATTDVSGRIKYVNEKFCEISKYSERELLGQDHRILNSSFHDKDFIRSLWRTIAQGHVWRGELRNRAKDSTLYWVDTTIVPFLNEHGKPWQYMAIRYDISERKRQEERLREQAALARVGEMAAVVAHEVRNPLAGIRGALQVIGSRLPAASQDASVLKDVLLRIDSLNGIVDDLLQFARPRQLRLTPLAIGAFMADAAAWLKQDHSMGLVEIDVEPSDVIIEADPDQLRLVFTNLLLNAAQAVQQRGRITIAFDVQGEACAVSVRDSGPGIPEEVRTRVFEPFFTTKHRGTGLGLPTAKRIVEMHGGTIDVTCPGEGGTVVTVVLPIASHP
jgi:PAS domain S-box-containing protein